MFSSLKEKLFNVQEEITSSLKNLTLRRGSGGGGSSSHFRNIPALPEPPINYGAGSELLEKYERKWKEIHAQTELSAKEAEKVGAQIHELYQNYERQWKAMWNLQGSLAIIPKLIHGVGEISDQILNTRCAFDETEEALLALENLIEVGELREKQLEHRFQLALYQERRAAELEDLKVRLTNEHLIKIQEFEKRSAQQLKMRQAVFQEAFESDLKMYKEGSLVTKPESLTASSSKDSPSLEEIELEDTDPISLEEFLADEEIEPEPEGEMPEDADTEPETPPKIVEHEELEASTMSKNSNNG